MSTAGPVKVVVDLNALTQLRTDIQTLRDELTTLGRSGVDTDADELGGADVAGAVDRFVAGWADGRQQIEDNLYACAVLLDQAIEEYTRTEAALSGRSDR